jgi:hypothetical protein
MDKSRIWTLYISVYTFVVGVPLLFFTEKARFVSFYPGEKIWVRFAGMVFLAFSYFNVVLYRNRLDSLIRVSFICQAIFAGVTGIIAFVTDSRVLSILAAILFIGTIGSILTCRADSKSQLPKEYKRMPKTSFWNLYVAGYTGLFGIGPLLLPRAVFEYLGMETGPGLWIKIVGMSFLVLSYYNIVAYRDQGPEAAILSILIVRFWFIAVLTSLALITGPPILFAIIGTVVVGIVGTIISYRKEKRLVA